MSEPQVQQIDELLDRLNDAESRLSELQEGLRQSHRLVTLGTVASIIAHEFNNLLTPVVSYCEMAMKAGVEADPELARKALERSHEGAKKAASIAESILGFSRGSGGESRAEVRAIVEEALQCLAREPAKDGITLKIEAPEGLTVAMSPVALQQVVMNLVLNARKAMGRRGGRLWIVASREGGGVALEVIDNGPGIPPERRESIFEPFVSGSSGDREGGGSDADGGTGLGLAICRSLIEGAGGEISAAPPREGEGARFRIVLPAAE